MKCPKCSAIIDKGDNFCEECGASINGIFSINNVYLTIQIVGGMIK